MPEQSALIVDDDLALAENLGELVESLGVNVEIVGTAAAARARTGDRFFDLVLVDVRLPDGSGTDLIEPIRRHSPHTEVLLITGNATMDTAIVAVRSGAFAYVLKPFSPPELLETVRRALVQVASARERERLAAELERSERQHREVVEAVPALVMAVDGEGRISLWNHRLEEVSGFGRGEMFGKPGAALVGKGGVRPIPVKGGGERLIRWERAIVAGSDGTWTYAVGIDVTAEQEMLRRTLRAERLAAVGTLAAGLAHEVRNPLNSAALQLQVLRRRLQRGETSLEALGPVVSLVEDEIRRLEQLVGDFLSFARPRPLELLPTALTELCQGVVALVEPEAAAAGVTVTLDLDPALPPLQADRDRLRQVLQNLVRNAVEAMPNGGELTIRARAALPNVEIEVHDTGEGFQDETPVFDAFFTTKPKGTGLGLSIVHRIVSDHGGTVSVRSRKGDTCFTLSLPIAGGGGS
jgi:signal transduction histidine kinase